MIHYYEKNKQGTIPRNIKTYCGLFVLDIIEDPNNDVDHVVLKRDVEKEDMCPKCVKHTKIQMQILKVTEL